MTVKELIHLLQNDYHPNAKVMVRGGEAREALYESLADTIPEEEFNRYSDKELRELHLCIY